MEVIEPVRVERTYVQKLKARPEDIFPEKTHARIRLARLLCQNILGVWG